MIQKLQKLVLSALAFISSFGTTQAKPEETNSPANSAAQIELHPEVRSLYYPSATNASLYNLCADRNLTNAINSTGSDNENYQQLFATRHFFHSVMTLAQTHKADIFGHDSKESLANLKDVGKEYAIAIQNGDVAAQTNAQEKLLATCGAMLATLHHNGDIEYPQFRSAWDNANDFASFTSLDHNKFYDAHDQAAAHATNTERSWVARATEVANERMPFNLSI